MCDLRSGPMRGRYHEQLRALLRREIAKKNGVTQESIAEVVKMHQTTVGGILKHDKGTFDVDEAAAALEHIGSSLQDFLAGVPPRELSATEKLARELATTPGLPELSKALLAGQQTLLPSLRRLAKHVGPLATERPPKQTRGRRDAPATAARTTKARAKRR